MSEVDHQPYFRLLVHGTYGGEIITLKISSESQMLGGSSILEELDRLFKLFRIFDIEYTMGCANPFHLLHTAVYKLKYGTVPKSVSELISVLRSHVN